MRMEMRMVVEDGNEDSSNGSLNCKVILVNNLDS